MDKYQQNSEERSFEPIQLVRNGSKPKLVFLGNQETDTILMTFETPIRFDLGPEEETGHRIAIFQYENLE